MLPAQGIELVGAFVHLLLSGIELGNGVLELGTELIKFLVDCDNLVLILHCFLLELTRYLSVVFFQLNVVRFKLNEFFIHVLKLHLFLADVIF